MCKKSNHHFTATSFTSLWAWADIRCDWILLYLQYFSQIQTSKSCYGVFGLLFWKANARWEATHSYSTRWRLSQVNWHDVSMLSVHYRHEGLSSEQDCQLTNWQYFSKNRGKLRYLERRILWYKILDCSWMHCLIVFIVALNQKNRNFQKKHI